MNQINLIGNLTADVELKHSQGGTAYVNFNIGVQRPYKDKQTGEYQSDFPRCKAFNKTAEVIAEHFSKGSKIGLTGTLQTGQYDDKDGKTTFTTDVMVNQVTFVERKGQSNDQSQQRGQNDSYRQAYGGQTKGQNAQQQKPSYAENPFKEDGPVDISDDDLPF